MAEKLMSGVFEGYGTDFAKVAYNTPDYDKLMHLEQNVYQFATAKNWQMMKELTLSLKDGDKIVPFKEFKNKAITILDEYNHRHLKTEYQAAIAGAQMASKWVDAENSARIARENGTPEPLLQYRTMEDQRVRDSHAALNRITRPVGDSFWSKYYPPNGWNCRCTAVRTFKSAKTSNIDTALAAAAVEPQKGFTVNLAKEGFVFPKDSPYYIGLPPEEAMKALQALPYERRFQKIYTSNRGVNKLGIKGAVWQHVDVDTENRYNNPYSLHLTVAKELADRGNQVEILPSVSPNEFEKRHTLFSGVEGNKNPDFRINGEFVEFKNPNYPYGENTIDNAIHKASRQAKRVLINIHPTISIDEMKRFAKDRFRNSKKLIRITFRQNGVYFQFPE